MVNPIGRLEGMAKGLFNATAQSADFFIDIAHEGLTGADKFEGNGVLDTVWGSWQDNVLGEGGVLQSLFGPDEFDENGNPNAAFGGHFFGSIPETVRKPATQILNPAMEALDAVYEYGVDRPIGTFFTYTNMVLNDGVYTIVDPSSWEDAWNATGSRSWGQAFALLSRGIDLDDAEDVERFEGTSYYNLVSGGIDLFSNWYLDPANIATFGLAKLNKAYRASKTARMLADGSALQTRQYRKFRERLHNIKAEALADPDYHFSQQFRNNQLYTQQDIPGIGRIAQQIKQAADKGALGNIMKGEMNTNLAMAFAALPNTRHVLDKPDAIDNFILLLTDSSGKGPQYENLKDAARTYVSDLYENGGLKEELAWLMRDVSEMAKIGPDGKALSFDEFVDFLESRVTDRSGRALHPQRASTLANMKFLRNMIDMEGKELSDLYDAVVLGSPTTAVELDAVKLAKTEEAKAAAKDLGLQFNPALADEVDPLGEGFFRWFRPTTTGKGYLRDKNWGQLSQEDKGRLLHWAGIPQGDAKRIKDFSDNWDELVETDRALDDVIMSARIGHRNKQGTYRPGDPEISQKLRNQGVNRMVDAMEALLDRDPVRTPRGGLEKHLLRKKGLISTKRVRRGRRPIAKDARRRGAPDLNATVTAAGNIQENALKALWDELNFNPGDAGSPDKNWENLEKQVDRWADDGPLQRLLGPDWVWDEKTKKWGKDDGKKFYKEMDEWKGLTHEERIARLKKALPVELHPYIGLTIDEIIDRFGRRGYSEKHPDGKPTEEALDIVDQIYEAIANLGEGTQTSQRPMVDYEGNPMMDEYGEQLFEDYIPEGQITKETQSAIPGRGEYIKRWAPPRQYRETTGWYEDVNHRPRTDQLTPEDGLDPHWQQFVDDVELNRLDSSYEWQDQFKRMVSGKPALKAALKTRTKFDDLSDEARADFLVEVDPGITQSEYFRGPTELEELRTEISDLKAEYVKQGVGSIKEKNGEAVFVPGRKASAAQKNELKDLETELRKSEQLLEGRRVDAQHLSEMTDASRDQFDVWWKEASRSQRQEVMDIVGGTEEWQKLNPKERHDAFRNAAFEAEKNFLKLPKSQRPRRTGDPTKKSLVGLADEWDSFVEYSAKWDEVLESKFGEVPDDFSEMRDLEVKELRAGANTVRELLAERQELRRSDPGEYERIVRDPQGNPVIDEATGEIVRERAPMSDEGIAGGRAQAAMRAAYKFGLRRPLVASQEIPYIAQRFQRERMIDEIQPEFRMWYTREGRDPVRLDTERAGWEDKPMTAWDPGKQKWVPLEQHPAFAENVAQAGVATTEGWIYNSQWGNNVDGTWIPVDEARATQLEQVEDLMFGVYQPSGHLLEGRIYEAFDDGELMAKQHAIEAKLANEYPDMPFATALIFQDARLKKLARRKDARDGRHENIQALYDALNGENADLIKVVADEIIHQNIEFVGKLETLPGISRFDEMSGTVRGGVSSAARAFGEQGYVKEFTTKFENKTGIGIKMPNIRVRFFVEKVPQGLIRWDDPVQAYEQFERMLRDAERVKPKFYEAGKVRDQNLVEFSGLNKDEILGRWIQNPDVAARQRLFNDTVQTLNSNLGKMFEGRIGQWKDGKFVNTSSDELTRILRRNWKSAQKEVEKMGKNARLYGNSQIRTYSMDEHRNIDVRQLPMTPQQLAEATLVPRYDLYANAFGDQSSVMKAAQFTRDQVGMTMNAFTGLWKKSVLLRPAWPIRVISDEFMRTAADYGTMNAVRGIASGFNDLRAGWFGLRGEDLAQPLNLKIRQILKDADVKIDLPGSGLRPINPDLASSDELIGALTRHYDGDHQKLQDVVKEVISEEYGKKKILTRTMGAGAVGAFLAGPAGLAAAGLYSLYSRGSMRRLAELETLNHMGYSLSQIGRHQINEEIFRIEQQLTKLDPVKDADEIANLIKKAQGFEDTRKILLTQAKQYQDQFTLRDRVTGKMRNELAARKQKIEDSSEDLAAYRDGTIVQNFDTAGKIMADAGVSDFHLDGLTIGNAFGNTPQQNGIYRQAISANQYKSTLWNSASSVTRKTVRQGRREQYDYGQHPKVFAEAFDDTVNRQWVPMTDPTAYSRPTYFVPRNETNAMRVARARHGEFQKQYQEFLREMDEKYGFGIDWTNDLTEAESLRLSELHQVIRDEEISFTDAHKSWYGENKDIAVQGDGTVDLGKQVRDEAIKDARWWKANASPDLLEGNPFQDFTRLFWTEAVTDDDILNWIRFGPGGVLRDIMPAHFTDTINAVDEWIRQVRFETDNQIPPIPEFLHLRRKLANGEEIKWARDVQPVIDNKFGGDIGRIRGLGYEDFGRIIGDSAFRDAAEASGMIIRAKRWTDEAFQMLGTMPTDALTRSTVFRSVYSGEVARRLPNFKTADGDYRLTQKEINAIEAESRRVAIAKTKNLLYDLAERTKFEELTANLMPFFAAYQEVITRWAGIATRNPGFVLATTRNFHNGLENFNAVDEETGAPLFLLRFGTILGMQTPDWLPLYGDKEVFGRFSRLGDNPIKFNLSSLSMMSGGLPGFGPLVAFAASEAAVQVPDVAQSLEWAFPYGLSEGTSTLERLVDSITPLWSQTLRSSAMDTLERQRVRARVASDMIVEYELKGLTIDSASDMEMFEDEVDDRVTAMLQVRMFANLASPISYMNQSPHAHIIENYKKIMETEGLAAADEWLLVENPEYWGIVGRQTRIADGAVASATLFGEEEYSKNPAFFKDNASIQDLMLGKIGPLDVQMAHNAAFNTVVYKKEIAEGRRVYQKPGEIIRRANGNAGWFWYEKLMAPIRYKQEQLRLSGQPSSLNAKANVGLKQAKQMIVQRIAEKYPLWFEQFNDIKTAEESAKTIHSLRAWKDNKQFEWHPAIPHMDAYFELRDWLTNELLLRSQQSGDPQEQLLSHKRNNDLKDLWERSRVAFSNIPDFSPVFVRYLEQDDVIMRASWPQNQKAHQILRQAA